MTRLQYLRRYCRRNFLSMPGKRVQTPCDRGVLKIKGVECGKKSLEIATRFM